MIPFPPTPRCAPVSQEVRDVATGDSWCAEGHIIEVDEAIF